MRHARTSTRTALLAAFISSLIHPAAHANPRACAVAVRAAVYVCADGTRGAGVVVRVTKTSTLILTAEHVVSDAAQIVVSFEPGGADIPARLLASNPTDDLALLEVDGQHGSPIELQLSTPAQGEEVVTVGTPRGLDFFARYGHVAASGARKLTDGPQVYLVLDMPGVPGMSGAAICGMDGRMVGLLSAGNPECGVVLAVPGVVVGRFLDGAGVR